MPNVPKLDTVITEYLASLEARRRSPNTIRANRGILTALLVTTGNIPIRSLTGDHIDRLFAAKAPDWGPTTQAQNVTVLRSFQRWCHQRRYLAKDTDLLEGYRTSKPKAVDDQLRIPVTMFNPLLDAAPHPRDRVTIALGLYLFLRAGELTNLRWSDYNESSLEMRVEVFKGKRYVDKNGEERGEVDFMPVSAELANELRRWKTYVTGQVTEPFNPDWYIACSKAPQSYIVWGERAGTYIDPQLRPTRRMNHPHGAVARALSVLGYERAANTRQGIHVLRRSGARALFDSLRDQGYDGALQRVKAMLHHSNQAMTEHYLGISVERTQRNDLLRGEIMFPAATPSGNVINLEPARLAQGAQP